MDVKDSVSKIIFVGPVQQRLLEKLNVFTVEDLLQFLPKNYIDLTKQVKISELKDFEGESVSVKATVLKVTIMRSPKKRMWIVEAKLGDQSGLVQAIWFNQPYLSKTLKEGMDFIFYGNISLNNSKPSLSNPEIFTKAGILTIYPQTKSLTSKQISRFIKSAIKQGYNLEEYFEKELIEKYGLVENTKAMTDLHFAKLADEYLQARQRIIFNKLFFLILANNYLKNQYKKESGPSIILNEKLISKEVNDLPYVLTNDQKIVLEEINNDLVKSSPMNRLVEGDVGSGKTVVAFLAALSVLKSGYKVIFMAPTEILTRQHFENARVFFKKHNIKIGLITSSENRKAGAKKIALESDLIFGTQALIQKDTNLKNVGLVVVDEQHRFGVKQREALNQSQGIKPHFLSLSATPIPRSLAHVIFSNLDLSLIREKPKARQIIKSFLIPDQKRGDCYVFLKKIVEKGQQIFIICPLIEDSQKVVFDDESKKAVETEIEKLKNTVLKDLRIEALHGKMKADRKEEIMARMQNGEIDILVATTVVEVGVDIKNATVMVIEDAEKFGLAQLHQLRGRVGRNEFESFCFAFSNNLNSTKTFERLKTFVEFDDGFKLADIDLKLRGPGSLLKTDQSGFKGFNPLWFDNSTLLKKAKDAAEEMVENCQNSPFLMDKIKEELGTDHLE